MTIDEAIEFERYLSKQPEICNEDFMKCEEHKQIAEWLEVLKQYRAIGTVEELQALKEKNEPYKPQEYEDRYYACKCDNILLPKWRKYPTELMPKSEGLPHCMSCGQKLDWQ
jgi:hypothetical protein